MRTPLLLLSASLLCLIGCNGHVSSSQDGALAPTLWAEDGPTRNVHNVANPNAPFAVLAAQPRLTHRPEIVDATSVPVCNPATLRVWESGADVNGPRHRIRYTVSNAGEACRIAGFPAVTLLDGTGTVLGSIQMDRVSDDIISAHLRQESIAYTQEAEMPSQPVLLLPEGRAAFELGWTSGAACQQVSRIAIAAPGSAQSVILPRQLSVCSDRVLLSAISPE